MLNETGSGADAPQVPVRALPGLSASLIAGSAVVSSGYLLGAEWLADPVMGLPFGIWLVGCGALIRGMWASGWVSRIAGTIESLPARVESFRQREEGSALPWPSRPVASVACSWAMLAAEQLAKGWFATVDQLSRWRYGPHARQATGEARAVEWFDSADALPAPVRGVRVGVFGPVGVVAEVLDAGRPGDPEAIFVRCRTAETTRHALAAEQLDAKIVVGDSQVKIRFREDFALEASWYDWSTPRPTTYGTVFPMRVDPAMVTLPSEGEPDARGVRVLALAGAWQSRTSPRLTLRDRFQGRRPADATPAMRTLLAYAAERAKAGKGSQPEVRAAARAANAWLATDAGGVTPEERREGIEATAVVLSDEVGSTLRLVAARFAAGDERAGLEAVHHADGVLRGATDLPESDHAAFVQSEIEHAGPSEMAMGRVAAGICLLAARTPAEKVEYLADDLMEELRFAPFLVGNDPDARVLHRVIKELARTRVAELRGLPAVAEDGRVGEVVRRKAA